MDDGGRRQELDSCLVYGAGTEVAATFGLSDSMRFDPRQVHSADEARRFSFDLRVQFLAIPKHRHKLRQPPRPCLWAFRVLQSVQNRVSIRPVQ